MYVKVHIRVPQNKNPVALPLVLCWNFIAYAEICVQLRLKL